MIRPGKPQLMNALRLFLAAWVAFAVATAFGIHHAFWASMPVWVVAQPWRGVVFERALWRVSGTVIGGAVGLALLKASPDPWFTALAMALLLALSAWLMHVWQGVKSYVPLMSGITVAVVVIPAMLDPVSGMDLALDRLACTFIGGVSVALIVGLFTPHAQFRDLFDMAEVFAAAALDEARATLGGRPGDAAQLLHRAAYIETRARLTAAGSPEGYRRMAVIDTTIAAALTLLETSSALTAEGVQASRQALAALDGPADIAAPAHGLQGRLLHAAKILGQARTALNGDTGLPEGRAAPRFAPPRNPDRGLAVALMVFAGSIAGSAAILLTGSFSAELTAFSMAVFALILGSAPLPHVLAPKVAAGVVAGVVAGAAYRIGVQPWIDGWPMLVMTIAPFMAFGALARAHPRTAVYALDANMCFMLASQAGELPRPAGAVLVDSVFMALGTVLMVLCYLALPRPGRRLIGATAARLRRDVDLLGQRAPIAPSRWGAIAGRRIMTLVLELDKAGEVAPREILALASLGHALNDLRARASAEGRLAECDAWLADIVSGSSQPPPFEGSLKTLANEFLAIWAWTRPQHEASI